LSFGRVASAGKPVAAGVESRARRRRVGETKELSKMKTVFGILSAVLFLSGRSDAADGFGSVRCGSDVRRALIGRTMSNEKVADVEDRHKDLSLRDLGGFEISDRLFLISWQICGDEYALLEEKNVVRDALKFPGHSKDSPEFIGSCRMNDREVAGTIIAVLKNEKGAGSLSATAAWKIDEKRSKFVELPTEGLRCPRDGVITSDGGR